MTGIFSILGVVVILILIMTINTMYKKPNRDAGKKADEIVLDKGKLAKNLSGMIQFKTITSETADGFDTDAFLGLHAYLEKTYPHVHQTLSKEVVGDLSLLYKWTGTGSDQLPMLMMAHMDVVPVDTRTQDEWEHGAFSGKIADGYVWGRGAIDMKGQLAAIMGAVEHLVESGFAPRRDIYIALGHDEEALGIHGAKQIVALLDSRDVRLDFVIDEGGVVMDGSLLGINAMVATIGICEKGYMDVKLTATSKGGHASRPPDETAVGALAKALVALEKRQMKPSLNQPLRDMLDAVGGYMRFPRNVITANLFITKPLLLKGLSATPTGSAMVRTTIAPTMLQGSTASNVLAEKAEAVVNFRISPDNTMESVLSHVKKVIKDNDINIEVIQGHEPSAISGVQNDAYAILARTAKEVFGDYVVAPYLMVAATDSRWYEPIADGVYRFQPFASMTQDLGTIHAVGERLAIDSLYEGTGFFVRLVKNADE